MDWGWEESAWRRRDAGWQLDAVMGVADGPLAWKNPENGRVWCG